MERPQDCNPFPIQAEHDSKNRIEYPSCTIPWWLAEEAYKEYSKRYGTSQSLKRLAERGGFGRIELLKFIRKEEF